MSRLRPIGLLLATLLLLAAPAAGSEPQCTPCHPAFKGQVRHQPVDRLPCLRCHASHASRYAGLLVADQQTLCRSCHPMANGTPFSHPHQPVRQGQCTACHAPHAADTPALLTMPLRDLCASCHGRSRRRYQHAPFQNGQCGSCHLPHGSSEPHLLAADADALCDSCHRQDTVRTAHPADGPQVLHRCLSCHAPHDSDNRHLLRAVLHPGATDDCRQCHRHSGPPTTELCLFCHQQLLPNLQRLQTHLGSSKGHNSCMQCHSPHGGNDRTLLADHQEAVCFGCHQETAQRISHRRSTHPLTAHCSDCHAVHGADNVALLKGNGNDLCTQCHKEQGAFSHPVGADVIDPRNRQPVTCITCHDPKASDYPYQLRLDADTMLCGQCHHY